VVVLFSPMACDKKYVAIPVFVISRFPVVMLMGRSFPSAVIPDPHPMPDPISPNPNRVGTWPRAWVLNQRRRWSNRNVNRLRLIIGMLKIA